VSSNLIAEGRSSSLRFADFEFDFNTRILSRDGQPVKIQPQPLRVLEILLERPGEIISREHLRTSIWGKATFVEFDQGLNYCIRQVRVALGDNAVNPSYVETLPRQGYRFVAEVVRRCSDDEKYHSAPVVSAFEQKRQDVHAASATLFLARKISYAIAAAGLLTTSLAAWWIWSSGYRAAMTPHISLLTVPNNLLGATISPDGRTIAYSSHDREGQSLWVRETEGVGAGVRLIPPAPGHFWGISYSPNGEYIYYVFNEEAHAAEAGLFRISVTGGEARKLMIGIAGAPVFSPDGRRILVKRYDPDGRGYLLTATPLGGDVKLIAQSAAAYPFYSIQWAPGGNAIRYIERATAHKQSTWSVWETRPSGPAAQLLVAPRPLRSANWLNQSEFLALIPDEDSGLGQMWRVSLPGTFRRLTNGISDFVDMSLTADGRTLLGLSRETHDNIWSTPAPGMPHAEPLHVSLPPGSYNYPTWTPDGRVVFAGQSNLWISTVNGLERNALIPERAMASEPKVSPDGRFVIFVSERPNMRNLWRVDLDGRNFRQVTTGQYDWHPAIAPDGKWFVYESRIPVPWTIWKVPLDRAGPAVKLVEDEGADEGIAISPDSKLFAFRTDVGGIEVRSLDDGKLVRVLTTPSDPSDLRWTPGGEALNYVCHVGRSAQVWSQPIGGDPPVRIPLPLPDDLLHIDWSQDGARVVYVQREIRTDLALISNFR
jgi:Tol biopolymer transport system component/DNA-binding winged helix-turn-helix (wHTH) protein